MFIELLVLEYTATFNTLARVQIQNWNYKDSKHENIIQKEKNIEIM